MLLVAKRDGETVEFQLDKITLAIKKAFKATGKSYTADIIELLSLRVTSDFQEKIKDSRISVEDIQDSVEKVLEESGYTDVAKAYILYRKQREKIRNLDKTILDYKDVVDNYVKVEDWRVKENSTITYSVSDTRRRRRWSQSSGCPPGTRRRPPRSAPPRRERPAAPPF